MRGTTFHRTMTAVVVATTMLLASVVAGATTLDPATPVAVQVVDDTPGDQFNAHIDGDLVVWSGPSTIRYRFLGSSTGVQTVPVAGSPAIDLLSEVDGTRIVFTRAFNGGRRALMLFDASVPAAAPMELDPQTTSNRFGSAINGPSVAYTSFEAAPNRGDISVYDLATGQTSVVSADPSGEQQPRLSPDGTVLVWERCAAILDCRIYKAIRSASGVWGSPSKVSSSDDVAEASASTDGTTIVWTKGNSTLVAAPVAGGAERVLTVTGQYEGTSIVDGLVATSYRANSTEASEAATWDLATDAFRLVTRTPALNEALVDLGPALPTGELPMTWNDDDAGFDARRILATTLRRTPLPGGPVRTSAIQQPINRPPAGMSTFKANRGVIPVKFDLALDGAPTCTLPPASVVVNRVGSAGANPVDESEYGSAADSGSAFRIGDCRYHYNLSAKKLGTGRYRVDIVIDGSISGSATFELV